MQIGHMPSIFTHIREKHDIRFALFEQILYTRVDCKSISLLLTHTMYLYIHYCANVWGRQDFCSSSDQKYIETVILRNIITI